MYWWPPPIIGLTADAPVTILQADRPFWLFALFMGPCTLFWLFAYFFVIRQASIDKYSGIPVTVVGVNFAWEFSGAFIVQQTPIQRPIDFSWMILDIFILRQALRYGHKDYPSLSLKAFRTMVLCILGWSVILIVASAYEFNDLQGIYTGTALNVFMSLAFILMLRRRDSSVGQSMYIAVCKAIGSFFAGVTVFVMFPDRHLFVVWFVTIWALDAAYIVLLHRKIRAEGASPWTLRRLRAITASPMVKASTV